MQFHAKYVSTDSSVGGDYYQASFHAEEETDDLDDSSPYLLIQRDFEMSYGGSCYIETHDERYRGHFSVRRIKFTPEKLTTHAPQQNSSLDQLIRATIKHDWKHRWRAITGGHIFNPDALPPGSDGSCRALSLLRARLAEAIGSGRTRLACPVDQHQAANQCEPQQEPLATAIDIVQAADRDSQGGKNRGEEDDHGQPAQSAHLGSRVKRLVDDTQHDVDDDHGDDPVPIFGSRGSTREAGVIPQA